MTEYSLHSQQAPSVPLRLLSSGQSLGIVESAAGIFDLHSLTNIPAIRSPLKLIAGARSAFVTSPVANQEVALRVLGLPGVAAAVDNLEISHLDFGQDNYQLLRLLSESLNHSADTEHQWRFQVLVIPRQLLKTISQKDPQFELDLLKLAFAESQSLWKSAYLSKCVSDAALSAVSAAESRAHFNEVLQIIFQQRLGHGPAEGGLLGPFKALLRLMFTSGLAKMQTLNKRTPAIIVPKQFDRLGEQASFFYYLLRSPSVQAQSGAPARPSQVMETISHGLKRLRLKQLIPVSELDLKFFASEQQPKAAVIIEPVAGNKQLIQDFGEQLEFAQLELGLDKKTALGDPRSGALGHLIRISNRVKPNTGKASSVRKTTAIPSPVSVRAAVINKAP